MSHAIDRLNAAAQASGDQHFTARFLGTLSANFDGGKLDPDTWDRAIAKATQASKGTP